MVNLTSGQVIVKQWSRADQRLKLERELLYMYWNQCITYWSLLDTSQFGHCLTTGQFDHCLTTGLFREPTHNSHWHRFGNIETWAQRDVGTKRRGHKISLFWAQRDVGTKYHFFGHKETWAQRDASSISDPLSTPCQMPFLGQSILQECVSCLGRHLQLLGRYRWFGPQQTDLA